MKVLVSDATRNVGLSVIHALAKKGHDIYSIDERRLPLGSKSIYAKKFIKTKTFSDPGFGQQILDIIEAYDIEVILPVLNTTWFVKNAEAIEEKAAMFYPDFDSYMKAFDNAQTMVLCKELGIDVPRVFNLKEAEEFLGRNNVKKEKKLVIKPKEDVGGGQGVYYVDSYSEIRRLVSRSHKIYGDSILQEYIPGGEKSMIALNVLLDRSSKPIASFAFRKLRQWPTTGGTTALGVSIDPEPFINIVMPFFKHLKWRGMADVEFKIDARDQKPKLIEINPRFTGAIAFSVHCGLNIPHLYCESAVGNKIEDTIDQKAFGQKFMNKGHFIKSTLDNLKKSNDTLKELKLVKKDYRGKLFTYKILPGDWLLGLSKTMFEMKKYLFPNL